ncbi:hypothetical protein D3C87_1119790 [compost metagenome]
MGLVHHHDPVFGISNRLLRPLELENGRERGVPVLPAADQRLQIPDALDRCRVRQAAGNEGSADLVVQIHPVCQHQNVRIGQRVRLCRPVRFQLQCSKDHGQRFAAALRVPDQPLPVLTLDNAIHDAVDGAKLLVTADFLDRASLCLLEHDIMRDQVQQTARLQQAPETLGERIGKITLHLRPGITPFGIVFGAGAGRAIEHQRAIGDDVEDIGEKQARNVLLILLDLLEGLAGLVLHIQWAFCLDHDKRNAVDVDHNVRLARVLRLYPKLMRQGKLVVARVEKIDHTERLPRLLAGHVARIVAA